MSDNTTETQSALHSNFFTNRGGNTLIKEFEGILKHNESIKHLDAVVGFLRASGYFSLRPFLNGIDKARVLIGIDVDKYIVEAAKKEKFFFGAAKGVKEDYLRELRADIEHSGYTKDIEAGILQMVDDLISGKLELRAHPSKRIHAKMYVLYPNGFNQYTQGMAITGSSNLSGNGLGISPERQYEFNVKLDRNEDVQFAKNEFELLWEEAKDCEITAVDIKKKVEETYLKGDVTPYDLYIKMLMEYFSDRVLAVDENDPFDMPQGYKKYEYQTDAVVEGYKKMLRYDGFFLADVVGLGKTIIATMIAKRFLIENGREHTKILVVYPPPSSITGKPRSGTSASTSTRSSSATAAFPKSSTKKTSTTGGPMSSTSSWSTRPTNSAHTRPTPSSNCRKSARCPAKSPATSPATRRR